MGNPTEYDAEAWTGDEDTAFTTADQGYDCDGEDVAVLRFEPTAGVATSFTIVPEVYRYKTGWDVATADQRTFTANAPDEVKIDVSDVRRVGFRVTGSAGVTAGNKYVIVV